MKAALLIASLSAAMVSMSDAQEHLVPEPGQLAYDNEYYAEAREVFAAAQKEEVICQVFVPAGDVGGEEVIGVRKTATGHEVFRIVPSSRIWDLELIRMFERGQEGQRDEKGNYPGLANVEPYQKLKKQTPADFRKITTKVEVAAIDEKLAQRISAVWERMLLATRHPKVPRGGHGISYHFSMFALGRGIISGQIFIPDRKTKTEALVDLAVEMSNYATGRANMESLKRVLSHTEKITSA